ncbi:M55 family metallopeptidase [Micromonospora sp. M12]
MEVLVSVDLEGISGIVHSTETNPDRYDYERGRALMTAEANAVVAGVLDAEPGAVVWVTDAHGTFRNILPEDLDRRAHLVRANPARWACSRGWTRTQMPFCSSATTPGPVPGPPSWPTRSVTPSWMYG